MRPGLLLAVTALLSGTACAKKQACEIPADLPRPMLEGRPIDQPRRLLPVGGYTLALTWSPERCAGRMTSPMDKLRCDGATSRFGFTLHGLWPDGEGGQWPQYCTPTRLVPDAVIRQHLCSIPSPQLIQHEWEKHGTCMAKTPADYFAKSDALFGKLRFPDMAELSGKSITARAFQQAFAEANEGMRANQLRLKVTRDGWLEEVMICLDKRFARTSCPVRSNARAGQLIRIR
jgi:ribonuclease T2